MIFDGIILFCVSRLHGERTVSGIYHLLKGKKSIQTVQDAHIYQLDCFYGIHKKMTKQQFQSKIAELKEKQFLIKAENLEDRYVLSESGNHLLEKCQADMYLDYFNGLKLNGTANEFYLRLLLLIQTLTNTKMRLFHFIPVTDNPSVEKWVKLIYQDVKRKEGEILQTVYQEMTTILAQLSNRDASIFVDRLTGFRNYGMSMNQLSEKYALPSTDMHLLLTAIIHKIIAIVQTENKRFPIHTYMLKDIEGKNQLTHSAYQTFQLLNKGYTVDQIAIMRNLKINTIHDHIVEIALYDATFQLTSYMSTEEYEEIKAIVNQGNSFKLKEIKKTVSDNISYFQIRLVLAVNKKVVK